MKENNQSRAVPAAAVAVTGVALPRRILVVDDDPVIRKFSQDVLIRHGYQVDAAESGLAAWKSLQCQNYDLLVTDNEMQEGSGVELITKLYAARKVPPAIIMATGKPPAELAEHPWLQSTSLLLKPYTSEEFIDKIQEVLRVTDDMQFI